MGLQKDDCEMKVQLADTSKASLSGKHLTTQVAVTGKSSVPFIIPKRVAFSCEDISPSNRCSLCSFAGSRSGELIIEAKNRSILEILGKADSTVTKSLKHWVGVCDDCHVQILSTQNVEELRVSPNVSTFIPNSEYVTRECYYLGHGLLANHPYELSCYCYPSPTDQRAVLVADKAEPLRDQIEQFNFGAVKESLEVFRAKPDEIFQAVYEDFASNVQNRWALCSSSRI